jgi:hypothetical protein
MKFTSLRRLSRLRHLLYKVDFNMTAQVANMDLDHEEPEGARVVVDDPEVANVISSRLHPDEERLMELLSIMTRHPDEERKFRNVRGGWHTIVLDIDHPAALVPSTTEGHFHLYIDVPLQWDVYCRLMIAMSDAGVLEPGYVDASINRGASFLRLPGVKKEAGQ